MADSYYDPLVFTVCLRLSRPAGRFCCCALIVLIYAHSPTDTTCLQVVGANPREEKNETGQGIKIQQEMENDSVHFISSKK